MPSCFMLFTHCDRRAASRAACTAGKSRAISTAMIAITTKSSISVKPRRERFIQRPPKRTKMVGIPAGTMMDSGITNPPSLAGEGGLLLLELEIERVVTPLLDLAVQAA